MKKTKIILLAVLTLFLTACSQGQTESASGKQDHYIIGSMSGDADVWDFIKDSQALKDAGLSIEVRRFDDGVSANTATIEGEVDANAFQMIAYLKQVNEETGDKLRAVGTTYLEPMGIYSDKYETLEEVPDGATVAISDQTAGLARGLELLQTAGLIELADDFDSFSTQADITSNPKNLQFVEVDDPTMPRVLGDVDIALMGNTNALEGGLNVFEDAIFYEEVNEDTVDKVNVFVTQKGREQDPGLQKLLEIYHSDDVKAFIDEEFGGTKQSVQLSGEELEEVLGL